MTSIRCQSCATFYDKKARACPDCGARQRPVNVALVNQRWVSNLNAQADHAVRYG